jgi:sugar phosphate isomerase/epimerase
MNSIIRIGNQSAFSANPLTLPFDFAVANGFDAFEWFPDKRSDGMGWQVSDLSLEKRRELRTKARDSGIRFSVHAPLNVDPLRNGSQEFEESLRLAVDLGAGLLNIHLTDANKVEEFARAVVPWIDRCRIQGVKLAIENIPATSPENFNHLFTLLPKVGVGMCFDVGHANLHQGTKNDYLAYLDRLRPEVPVIHLHAHENWGDRDSHLVLFTGPAGRDPMGISSLLKRLTQRGFDGSIVFEQWPELPDQLKRARDRLLDMLHGEQK